MTEFLEYKFKANVLLDHQLCHAISCEVFGKDFLNKSLSFNKNILTLRTDLPLLKHIKLFSYQREIQLIQIEEPNKKDEVLNGNKVTISGVFCYTKTQANQKRLRLIGEKNIPNENLVLEFCSKLLGIKNINYKISFRENYIAKTNNFSGQVMNIHNCFVLEVTGTVENESVLNKAINIGCGQKRSYGFGLINIKTEKGE